MKYPILLDDFGLRSLVIQELFQTKNATCIVARVSPRHCPLEQGLVLVAQELSQILIWRKIRLVPDEKSHGLRTQRKSTREKKYPVSDDFALRRPAVQKPCQTKSATSILARSVSLSVCAFSQPGMRLGAM